MTPPNTRSHSWATTGACLLTCLSVVGTTLALTSIGIIGGCEEKKAAPATEAAKPAPAKKDEKPKKK